MTRETAYYLDNMYKMFSRGLAILFINSMGIVMKWSTLKLRGGQSVLRTEGDATWSSLQEGKTWTEWDLASLLGTSRFWGDGCGVAGCGVITGIIVEHRHGEPLLNPIFIRLREPILWLPVSYGRRFSRRWRRLDGSATDLPPSNSRIVEFFLHINSISISDRTGADHIVRDCFFLKMNDHLRSLHTLQTR